MNHYKNVVSKCKSFCLSHVVDPRFVADTVTADTAVFALSVACAFVHYFS